MQSDGYNGMAYANWLCSQALNQDIILQPTGDFRDAELNQTY